MRTAQEIIKEHFAFLPSNVTYHALAEVINLARLETIVHCSEQIVEPIYDFNGKRHNDQLQKMILDLRAELK